MFGLRSSRKAPPLRPAIRDPFEVVPLRPDNVDVRRDSHGLIHLRLRKAIKGLKHRLADLLGYDYTRKVELDKYGTLYYSLIDGARTLREIVERMGSETEQPVAEIERQVILFTKKLMTMNMVLLKVPANAPAEKRA